MSMTSSFGIDWSKSISTNSPRRGRRRVREDVACYVRLNRRGSEGEDFDLVVTMYPEMLKTMGFANGDRFLFQFAGKFLAMKKNDSGHALSASNGKNYQTVRRIATAAEVEALKEVRQYFTIDEIIKSIPTNEVVFELKGGQS